MPKITARAAVLTVVFALALTGCAGAPESAPAESAAPLVAETADPTATTAEQTYVETLRSAFDRDGTSIPDATDEQLIAAGADACAQIADGKEVDDVRVIEGETLHTSGSYVDSLRIAYASIEYLCPTGQ